MEEMLKQSLGQLLNWATEVGDFLSVELPIFAQEIIQYGIWSNGVGVLIGLSFVVVLLFRAKKLYKKGKEEGYLDGDFYFLIMGICLFFAVLALIFSIVAGFESFKALLAPRLYLIEQLTKLLK